jgi:hypothetical protein
VGIFSPDRAVDFFSGDELSRLIRQQGQHECGLRLKSDAVSVAGQFTAIRIEREGAKCSYPVLVKARCSHIVGEVEA